MIMPFSGKQRITQMYSDRHNGIDIYGLENDDIYAVMSGRVLLARQDKVRGYGNQIIIEDELGNCWLYAHLSEILVKEGGFVQAGSKIGVQGNTGNSRGKHLHLGYFIDGSEKKAVDPAIALNIDKPEVGKEIEYIPETYIKVKVLKQTPKAITVEYDGLKGTLK